MWPTSWHITRFLHADVLYVAVLKYVSLSFTVPCVMWSPDTHIDAMPSHPFFPYLALHTSPCPAFGLHVFGLRMFLPGTIWVSNTEESVQSAEAVASTASHVPETLSPNLTVKGFAVRAQWYGPHA